ncbi:hypothetical protein [Levilactobacillus cerevisiae]|uniref:hypothetical protein n=1 Tax=Levilactobacillus cerevisiae TaxID=1704076 RepID=UPI000F794929|nr:hypothetical protein [Levilactobacillus cerevisiae]
MATPNVGILTTAGKALIDKVNSGQAKISFSKIVFSSMDNSQLSDMQVKALTAIAPQEVVVSSPETTLDTNSGETRIRATGTNEKLADGVYVKTYGVFAKDDTGSEILYGVTVSPNPNYFPAYDGVTPQAVTYSYKTVIQETSNITMTNSNDVYASQEDLAEALQPYAKTVDVNQQLDKKVNIADMRKPASDVAGIEEVNAKQDKIGYTPADDSTVLHNNALNQILTDNSGIIIGNDKDFGFIKRQNYKGGLAIGSGNSFHFLATNDAALSNTSEYHDVWNILPNGQVSILDGAYFTPADDSKVAHLSGANNFDTVPTVNNNPLLLASSLPSDLARTSQQTNFTAGLQSGGISVATSDDLKSVADSAWYIIPENNTNTITDIGWMKRDPVNKYLYILYNFASVPRIPTSPEMIVDLSSYVDALDDALGYIMLSSNDYSSNGNVWNLSDPHRSMSTVWARDAKLVVGLGFNFYDLNDGNSHLKLSTFNDNVDNNPWTNKCLRVHYNNWIRS